jgi:hypothetical protein
VDVLGIDFLDLLLHLANQLCAGRHPNTSKASRVSILQKV